MCSRSQNNHINKKTLSRITVWSSVQSQGSGKYKQQGEQFCINIKVMLGNFEIKFKVVFCFTGKLKSHFVRIFIVLHHTLE